MKKFIVYCLLFIVYCLLFIVTPPAFAHNGFNQDYVAYPLTGCPPGHEAYTDAVDVTLVLCRDSLSSSTCPADCTTVINAIGGICPSGCKPESVDINTGIPLTCIKDAPVCTGGSSGTCNDTDNPSGTSLPGQQTGFGSLMFQIGTRGTCNDSVVTNRTDYCSSTQLVEHYCVVNSTFSTGRCFETLGPCPAGQTCDISRGACVSLSGGSCPGDCTVISATNGVCPSGCNIKEFEPATGQAVTCISNILACSGGGPGPGPGGGTSGPFGLGTIISPFGFNLPFIPSGAGATNVFVAGLVRNGIGAMILIAFVVALIWTILAGFKFILANGEPKEVSAAWSQIRYGLIGLAVIMSAFAIIRIAETFFGVDIISGGLRLPTRSTP